jgi:AcrR family transcriptional regulator
LKQAAKPYYTPGIRSIIFFKIGQILKSVTSKPNGAIMAGKTKVHEEQIEQSRSWIFEGLLCLMDKRPYNKISVADITARAGVARQTFYRHYKNKDDVIFQFLETCFSPSLLERKNNNTRNKRRVFMITLPLDQFIRHAKTIKKILLSGAEYLIAAYSQKWQDYMTNLYSDILSAEDKVYFRYLVLFSISGSTQIICDWIKHDMPVSIEKLAIWLTEQDRPYYHPDSNIPKIVLSIKK